MAPSLALDLTRLALAPVRRVPRGIDRVELAYARHFLNNWPGECLPVLPMPWGVRCYDRKRGIAFLAAVEALWRETIEPSQDIYFAGTKSFLSGDASSTVSPRKPLKSTLTEQTLGFTRLISATGFTFGRSVSRAVPKGAVYLNVGQLEVFRPLLTWLHRRRDVRGVFMIHDVIPLELPEHHMPIGIRFHRSIMRNTAEFARALIVPSIAARDAIGRAMSSHDKRELPVHVELLPVSPEFLVPSPKDDAVLSKANYFIVLGAIDSYKNHLLLLEIWCALVARHGQAAPKLVIAGTPGPTSDAVLDFFRRSTSIHNHVTISSGLSTPALRQLVANARALLMPSLAEGFGLPVGEALAQHTPVLASDIPAHREAGAGGDVTYLDPRDPDAWRHCIEQMAELPRRITSGQVPAYRPKTYRPKTYRPKTWPDYFTGIEGFLTALEQDVLLGPAA